MNQAQQVNNAAKSQDASHEHVLPANNKLEEKYTILEKLGSGTQGHVYKAVRHSDNKIVAIKKLRIDSVNTWKEYDLFHREAEVLSQIHEHGVAEFYEAMEFLEDKPPAAYIVQELIEGRSLQLMLKSGFRFTVSRIFKMAYDLVVLLEKLHAHHPPIIHRDIKPNNIIMRPMENAGDFEPYLIDFGAVANPVVQKGGSTLAGTYGYMPPEQLVGIPCPASDIYALGVTIVYMLCGVDPKDMRNADYRLIFDNYLENVPRPVVRVLHLMTDPKPETRLCDYDKLKSIFMQFANDNYILEDDDVKLAPNLIDEKLYKVNAFNQAGNLDLWMMLPENTPRLVPDSFTRTILSAEKMQENLNYKNRFKSRLPRFIIIFAVLLLFVYLTIFVNVWWVILLIIAALASLIVGLDTFGGLAAISRNKESVQEKIDYYKASQSYKDIQSICAIDNIEDIPILTLLKYGRKAIATIIDFEDMPIPNKNRRLDRFTREVYSEAKVPFRLRYRFNPPDDASADDLVHEITIYNHQTEGLEPGTPIPILYFINPDDNSDVMSIPYPFPFKEIENTQKTIVNKENLYSRTRGVY